LLKIEKLKNGQKWRKIVKKCPKWINFEQK